jgi:hypothetical protein
VAEDKPSKLKRNVIPDMAKEKGVSVEDLLISLYEQYGSQAAIAQALNISQSVVSYWVNVNGLEVKYVLVRKKQHGD